MSSSFVAVFTLGFLILLTDLWQTEHWLVPQGNLLTPAIWQALLGIAFLLVFIVWTWYAFISPPRYSRRNAVCFAQTVYQYILRGIPEELAIVADELLYSMKSLVFHAPEKWEFTENQYSPKDLPHLSAVQENAHTILGLIADKRFCRAIITASPITALKLFDEMAKQEKYAIGIRAFGNHLIKEALADKNSFVYHESNDFYTGLLGKMKPLSQAIFGKYEMVEEIGTLLDVWVDEHKNWDTSQWEAYYQLALITLESYLETDFGTHSYVLYRVLNTIKFAVMKLPSLDGLDDWGGNIKLQKLNGLMNFIKNAVKLLNRKEIPASIKLRSNQHRDKTIYDFLAELIVDIIFAASKVRSPQSLCWTIQHNTVWAPILGYRNSEGQAAQFIRKKVCKLLYKEIKEIERFSPYFYPVSILGYCLNVLGIKLLDRNMEKGSRRFHQALLMWTKKHYAKLYSQNPQLAEKCLVSGMHYDKDKFQLSKAYQAALGEEPEVDYMDVAPWPVATPPIGEQTLFQGYC